MRLFILGANGHTGTQLLDLALSRGHEVTAFVRSPEKIARRHPQLTLLRGDPHDARELARALPGHDAVLSALGVRPPRAFRPHTLVRDCAASTVDAMTTSGVRRLVLVSAAALFPEKGLLFAFFRWLLTHIRRDLAAAEEIVRATALEWTIVRPPRLVNAPDEVYRSLRDALPARAFTMSFRAVAAFMLDAVERHAYERQIVGLAR
ncbi:MAG TPA: NAD(P)-binding oxidoreductase [Patescibacteria group bacterium]|nr:NAD(P)-binding oxidoreductase [Patescibacteria group bacterium]